jgi:hypothetical protein
MARVKSKQGKGGKKVDAGKVSKSSHQYGEPMVGDQAEIKAKKVYKREECEREGCTTGARSRGLCRKHGGGKRCSEPDCEKAAQKGGWCSGHGANVLMRMPCQIEGCCKIAKKGVYCQEHAGDYCSVEGCGTLALRYGLCTAHGGGYQKPCYTEGCGNIVKRGEASAIGTRWGGIALAVWRSVTSTLRRVGCASSTSRRPRTQRAGTDIV